jgi:hypothetical protein
MFKKTKTLLIALSVMFAGFQLAPAVVSAGPFDPSKEQACKGAALRDGAGCAGGASGLAKTIKTIVNILSTIVGIAAVIMIVVGGFRYVTSGGDSGNISSAKNTIIYAIVGLIIVALAQAIVRFILGEFA